ncbi:MAG: UDP-N-acetylmuramate dehydrogenase [Bacteroidales bacterium]|nr:UDP-N-acetylmuramate dehydrogenase [Bacteroidales bacterium]
MQIIPACPLQALNTFKIAASCKQLIIMEQAAELDGLRETHVFDDKFYILGGGSNTLFTQDFDGSIIQLKAKGITIIEETQEYVVLEVGAGEEWADFLQYCLTNNLYGAENLTDIPGWVGSAPMQNIGAYGVEVKDIITKVNITHLQTGIKTSLSNQECQFGYRSSIFKTALKNRTIITSVQFKLSKKPIFSLSYQGLQNYLEQSQLPLCLENVTKAVQQLRKEKLPDLDELGCAGSFFKNPIIPMVQYLQLQKKYPKLASYPIDKDHCKVPAGALIEYCGLKGHREGAVGIYPKQALVIVNYGEATGAEIDVFSRKVIQNVNNLLGIELEREVNII